MTVANLYCKHPALRARKAQMTLPAVGTQLFLHPIRRMQVFTHGTTADPINSHHCPARASRFAFIHVFQLLAPLREMLFSIKTSPLLL